VRHFHEKLESHGIELSYTWTNLTLQAAGLAEKLGRRGTYRRARERRPMRGMLIHMDASTHVWVAGQPKMDLVATLDDATGEILDLRFVDEEGTLSTLIALHAVLTQFGRFCELYTDRGSHFKPVQQKDGEPIDGQVSRALRTLGIRQILARSPQARGRSERMFQTLQGRLPQELRLAGVKHYGLQADQVLEVVRRDINRRFSVRPDQPESSFVPVAAASLPLILSIHQERTVGADHCVSFKKMQLQIPPSSTRISYARCKVIVHQFTNGTLGISFQGQLLASYTTDGELLRKGASKRSNRDA
jgi:hypothetical protein